MVAATQGGLVRCSRRRVGRVWGSSGCDVVASRCRRGGVEPVARVAFVELHKVLHREVRKLLHLELEIGLRHGRHSAC